MISNKTCEILKRIVVGDNHYNRNCDVDDDEDIDSDDNDN
jgi:hypothetical protein